MPLVPLIVSSVAFGLRHGKRWLPRASGVFSPPSRKDRGKGGELLPPHRGSSGAGKAI